MLNLVTSFTRLSARGAELKVAVQGRLNVPNGGRRQAHPWQERPLSLGFFLGKILHQGGNADFEKELDKVVDSLDAVQGGGASLGPEQRRAKNNRQIGG